MVKHVLRKQGYSVTEYYPKRWKVTLIWVVLALAMIAAVLFSSAAIRNAGLEYSAPDEFSAKQIFDFFDNIALSVNTFFKADEATSVIYLLAWLGIFAIACYTARNIADGNSERKKWKTIASRAALAVLILAAVFFFMAEISYYYNHEAKPPAFGFLGQLYMVFYMFFAILTGGIGGIVGIVIYLIFIMFAYLALKLIITIFACDKKYGSIKLKFIPNNLMPVCHCKEAFKTLPAFLINFVPAVFMYSVLQIMAIRSGELILVVFLTFFISFDLTAAVYILFSKLRRKPEFISLDNHIYDVTVFKEPYIKFGGKHEIKSRRNVRALIKQQEREKLFVQMKTCLNHKCEHYAVEFKPEESGAKRCPTCGGRKYTAKVFTAIKTCLNRDCEQFGEELKTEIGECALCGEKTGYMATKFNPDLVMPSIIATLGLSVGYFIFMLAMWYSGINLGKSDLFGGVTAPLINIFYFLALALYAISIVIAYFSSNKKALALAIAAMPVVVVLMRLIVL